MELPELQVGRKVRALFRNKGIGTPLTHDTEATTCVVQSVRTFQEKQFLDSQPLRQQHYEVKITIDEFSFRR